MTCQHTVRAHNLCKRSEVRMLSMTTQIPETRRCSNCPLISFHLRNLELGKSANTLLIESSMAIMAIRADDGLRSLVQENIPTSPV
jgi:hypothetical protein